MYVLKLNGITEIKGVQHYLIRPSVANKTALTKNCVLLNNYSLRHVYRRYYYNQYRNVLNIILPSTHITLH
jgi:hypothetical protein